jgi:hypothetical protein
MENNQNNVITDEYGARKFFYNNALFMSQCFFGVFGVGFSAAMLIIGRPPEVYLPVMTAILGWFMPSPLNHRLEQPSGIPQIREILSRNFNINV